MPVSQVLNRRLPNLEREVQGSTGSWPAQLASSVITSRSPKTAHKRMHKFKRKYVCIYIYTQIDLFIDGDIGIHSDTDYRL